VIYPLRKARCLTIVIRNLLAAMLAFSISAVAFAVGVQIVVTDTASQPVADAVIFADSAKPATADTKPALIDQIDRAFVPRVNVIQQGQSVIFPNSDNIRHHVYSFSTPKVFEIQLYAGVPKTPILFDKPGVVVLGCNIHDAMVGYLVVAPGDVFAKTDASGVATMNVSSTPKTVNIWHPSLAADKSIIKTIDLPAVNTDGRIHIQLELAANPPAAKDSSISRLRSLRRAN
jgi:plastocyanin